MQSDFEPVHLKEANEKLDELLSSSEIKQEQFEELKVEKSLWKRFVGLFKSNPFELPEDIYKLK